jgi:hypothetical protein
VNALAGANAGTDTSASEVGTNQSKGPGACSRSETSSYGVGIEESTKY